MTAPTMVPPRPPAKPAATPAPAGLYRGIVHSTALLGAARVGTVFFNFARDKALALALGPVGVGVFGLFEILIATVVSTSSLGVNVSGVREIAHASGKSDAARLAHAVASLRRLVLWLGVLGSLALVAFAEPIGRFTFGRDGYTTAVQICGIAVFFTSVQCGHRAILQGLNRIRSLAKVVVGVALADTVILVTAVVVWGRDAIAPGFAASAAAGAAIYWWVSRSAAPAGPRIEWSVFRPHARALITLGVSLAAALFLSTYVTYLTRTLINRDLGLAEAGLYLAAFTVAGKSVGFLLDSMRADLYPRLSAAADDNVKLNQLVNGQTEICLLLTIPGIVLVIALAPYLLQLFYSAEFASAAPLLGLFSLGSLARVLSTPLGYVRLAKGRSVLYFSTEAVFAGLQLVLAYLFLRFWGLTGVVVAYTVHAALQTWFLAHTASRLTGFRWSRDCLRLVLILVPVAVVTFGASLACGAVITALLGSGLAAALGTFNLRELAGRLGPEHRISRLAARLRLVRS